MDEGVQAPSPLEDIMKKVLLNKNPYTGKQTWIEDTVDGLQVNTQVNVSPVLDFAKKQEGEYRYGSLIGNTQKHQQKIAEIPAPLFFELQKKFGHFKHNKKKWLKWLQDPENKHFRTTGGRLT